METVKEAREVQKIKRGLHMEFGGKCPKDIHAGCKTKVSELEEKINKLEYELQQHRNGEFK